jgi:hypothetical protein
VASGTDEVLDLRAVAVVVAVQEVHVVAPRVREAQNFLCLDLDSPDPAIFLKRQNSGIIKPD